MDSLVKFITEVTRLARSGAWDDEAGQGMIEYGLLVALISIVAIVVVTAIGGGLTNNFQSVLNVL